MATGEFDLIGRFFTDLIPPRADVLLGVGDDGALMQVPDGHHLISVVDTLVSGVHFFADVDAKDLGFKALAVNLSDIAAMGGEPAWATLALTLPQVDEGWLQGFSTGFHQCAQRYGVSLVGGDTTSGPLTVTVQVNGLVPIGQALRRDGAQVGDDIYVSGDLGGAALAVERLHQGKDLPDGLRQRLQRPQPRMTLGRRLAGSATSCIDVSDGLLADLGHLCRASGVGARLGIAQIPMPDAVQQHAKTSQSPLYALVGGDDYELCFTLPKSERQWLSEQGLGLPITRIGEIISGSGVTVVDDQGRPLSLPNAHGFQHF